MIIKLNKKGITLPELAISCGIGLFVTLMIHYFVSGTRDHYMHGTVNLQSFHEARSAINALRRDFSSSTPFLKDYKTTSYEDYQKAVNQIFVTPAWAAAWNNANRPGELIQVSNHTLLFYKFIYGDLSSVPKLEMVTYEFDNASKTLKRQTSSGVVNTYNGFQNVSFKIYTHQINPKIPFLRVDLTIHEALSAHNNMEIGTDLELNTSLTSQFLPTLINNQYWRFATNHQLN